MPRTLHNQLSARFVESVNKPGLFLDGHGLYLRVSPSNSTKRPKPKTVAKSWTFRFRHGGKYCEMGLGPTSVVSLADARDKAKAAHRLLLEGVHPQQERKRQRQQIALDRAKAITFGESAEQFIKANRASWKNEKHADQWQATLETYCSALWKLPVQQVDTALVVKALEPIWTEKAETASRLRARIERVLDWAKVREFRAGENPARWKGHLDKLLPKLSKTKRVKHHPALPFSQMGAFMVELRQREALAARALETLVLTAVRTNELIGMHEREVDFAKAVWTIPADRMKAGRPHRVPLAPAAIKLLRSIEPQDGYYFPISNMGMLALLERMNFADDAKKAKWHDKEGRAIVPHGFRSSFRDWASEMTNFPREVCEMALAHAIQNKSEAAYRRDDLLDKRRPMMEAWAKFCAAPQAEGRVIPMRKRG